MKVDVVKTFKVELTEEEVTDFIEMCNDIHEGKPYDSTLIYQLEETFCNLMNTK